MIRLRPGPTVSLRAKDIPKNSSPGRVDLCPECYAKNPMEILCIGRGLGYLRCTKCERVYPSEMMNLIKVGEEREENT